VPVSSEVNWIDIEVAYGTPAKQVVLLVRLGRGTSVEQAIRRSGVLQHFPEIDLARNAVAIFGNRVRLTDVVDEGDRLEIYRPLACDPKRVRHQRADKLDSK
jgi:putative ubiquitin-RnfH superfamily antitoxin RatB of RatAB toxin-antitoxin module